METRAGYYDGRCSARREATLSLAGDSLRLDCEGGETTYPLAEARVTRGVGGIRRNILLPDGGMCEVTDGAFLATVERFQGRGRRAGLLHRWEQSLPLVVAALVLTGVVVTLFLHYGVPALARRAAEAVPLSTEKALGREALATLDHLVFKKSSLDDERRNALILLFARMTAAVPEGAGYRLEFRSGRAVGANALALPSGIVVVTDDLVRLARSDEEIAGVLAHEIGHVRGRHLLRHVLQSSATGLIIATMTGDILSVTSFSAALPTALLDAKFSRDFEREADDAAVAYLQKERIPLQRYGEFLARLQTELDVKRKGAEPDDTAGLRSYLSTHPETGERIRRVLAQEGDVPSHR